MKSRLMGLGLVALIALIALAGCSAQPAANVVKADALQPETIPVVMSEKSSAILAEAIVVAAERRALTFEIGGTVREILVNEGDAVHAGDPLVRLDRAALERAVATAEQNVIIQNANLDTLLAGATAADIAAAEAALHSAQQALQRVKDGPTDEDLAAAQANLDAARETHAKLLAGPDALDLAQVKARLEAAESARNEAQAYYDQVSYRNDIGALPQSVVLQRATIEYNAALAAYEDAAAGADADQLAGTRASVANAEAALGRLLDSPTDAELASAEAAVVGAQSRLTTLLDGATVENIAIARAAVAQAEIGLAEAGDTLNKATLVAPFDGTVTQVQVEVGDLVPAGRVVITLATTGQLQVRTVDLVEADVVHVTVGQPAIVTIDALPGVELAGHVTEIKLEPVDYRGDVAYPVVVALDQTHPRVMLGMTAQVELPRE